MQYLFPTETCEEETLPEHIVNKLPADRLLKVNVNFDFDEVK